MWEPSQDSGEPPGVSMKRYLSEPISQNVSREEVAHFVMQVIGSVNVRVCTTQVPSGRVIRIFVIETANIIQAELKLCTRAFKISSGFIRFFPAESVGLTFNLQPLLKLSLKFKSQNDDQYLKDLLGHLQRIGQCQVQSIKSLKDECALQLQVQPNYTLASLVGDSDIHLLAFRGVPLDVQYHDELVSIETSKKEVDIEELLGQSLSDQRSTNLPSSTLTDTYVSSSELSVLSQAIMTRLAIEETTTASGGSQKALKSPAFTQHDLQNTGPSPNNDKDDELSDLEEDHPLADKSAPKVVDFKSQTILKTFQKKMGIKGSVMTPNQLKQEILSKKAHRSVVEAKPSQEAFRKLIRADSPSKQEVGVPDHLRWVHLAALKQRTEHNTNKLSGSSLLQEIFSHQHEVQRYSTVVRECLEERCRKLIQIKDKLRLEKHMKKKLRKEKKRLRSAYNNLQTNHNNKLCQSPSWVEDEESDDSDSDDESEEGENTWNESQQQPQLVQGNYRKEQAGVNGALYPPSRKPAGGNPQQPYSAVPVDRPYSGRPGFGYSQARDFANPRFPEDSRGYADEFHYNQSGGYRHPPASPLQQGMDVPMYGEPIHYQPPRAYQAAPFHDGRVLGNRQPLRTAGASFGHFEPYPLPANYGLGYQMASPWEVPGPGYQLNNPAAWQRVEQPPIPPPTQYMPGPNTLYPPRTPWSNPGFYPN